MTDQAPSAPRTRKTKAAEQSIGPLHSLSMEYDERNNTFTLQGTDSGGRPSKALKLEMELVTQQAGRAITEIVSYVNSLLKANNA